MPNQNSLHNFDCLMSNVVGYQPLVLDKFNNVVLELALDGLTCRILSRKGAMFDVVATFQREIYWSGECWSDVDIDEALSRAKTGAY